MIFHFAVICLIFFPQILRGHPNKTAKKKIPAVVPNAPPYPHALIQGMIAYAKPNPNTFFNPMIRRKRSGARG